MNILLTDLQSLTLEAQEIPALANSGAHSFVGMLHQQFPGVADEGVQAIEFKDFFENIPLQIEASAVTLEASPTPSPWHQASARITAAADPASTGLLEQVGNQASAINLNARVPTGIGELLPAGGNQLPQDSSADICVAGPLEIALKTPLAESATPPAIPTVDIESVKNPGPAATITPAATVQSALIPPAKGNPDQESPLTIAIDAITTKSAAGLGGVAPKDKIASPGAVPPIAGEVPVVVKTATDIGQPGDAEVIRDQVTAAEALPSRPEIVHRTSLQPPIAPLIAGRESTLDEPSQAADRIVGDAKKVATAGLQPAREASPDVGILRRDNMPANDFVPTREVTANADTRGFELPAQASGNAAQQSAAPVVSSTAGAPVPGVGNVTNVNQPNPLPPQLESMSLARNADSSEWGNGLSERVSWMINQKQNSASIRLDPPALGRLEVQIKIVDDATTISIQTQTLQTRDLIEAASTRLRDFLQESGYQNVNVDVSQRQDQQQARAQTMANSNPDQDDSAGQEQSSDHEQPQHAGYFRGDGLVDTFA
jgi:hypothetical protein